VSTELRLLSILAFLSASAAHAHHAFAPVYDGSKTVAIEGLVTSFKFVNPHATMTVDVPDTAGNVATWTIEFAGRLNLANTGWTEDSVAVGERIRVTGNPTHTGSPRLFFVEIVREDGTVLGGARSTRLSALEEERKQRIQQRESAAPKTP
jgi:hypothetical protein